jgi:hypothetical protein
MTNPTISGIAGNMTFTRAVIMCCACFVLIVPAIVFAAVVTVLFQFYHAICRAMKG